MSGTTKLFAKDVGGRCGLTVAGQAEFKRQVNLPASASQEELRAAVKDPPVGSEYQRRIRAVAMSNGVKTGAIAPGRRQVWERAFDTDPDRTVASLATTARVQAPASVRARAEAELAAASEAATSEPSFVLGCFARAVDAEPKPAAVSVPARASSVATTERGEVTWHGLPTRQSPTSSSRQVFGPAGWTDVSVAEAGGVTEVEVRAAMSWASGDRRRELDEGLPTRHLGVY